MAANENNMKMAELLDALKRQKNGETVALMVERGLHYPVNYGVSTPVIRMIALDYATDHTFAKFLYGQGVRELKLASFVIADPELLSAEDSVFWAEGLVNSELSENFGSWLLARSPSLAAVPERWLCDSQTKYVQYAALIALCKAIDAGRNIMPVEDLRRLAQRYSNSRESILRRAADNLEVRLY